MSPYPGMSTATPGRGPRLTAVMREGENVTPLELFFDLVFVLALTQCTALMAADPSWDGLVQGLLVLGVLWWSWTGYAWLTSVVNPEEGAVRLVMFTAMAAFLVAALCVPEAFDSLGLLFACAYGVVRWSQIALFVLASRDDPAAAAVRDRPCRGHGRRGGPPGRGVLLRRHAAGRRMGAGPGCWTWASRSSSAPRDGS